MSSIFKTIAKVLIALLLYAQVHASGITISNVTVIPNSNQIQFDISWENSWRSDVLQNRDAAWLFIKYKDIDGNWKHLDLTNTNNAVPVGYAATIPADNKGAFLFRSVSGNGTSAISGVKLGIPAQFALGVYDIRVFGIEMVFIPAAPFWAGDFATSTNSYRVIPSTSTLPILVTGPNVLGPTDIYDPIAGQRLMDLVTGFPKGRDSFYCMKYEVSQGAYRDFLNTLNYTQQVSRTTFFPNSAVGAPALANTTGDHRSFIEIAVQGIFNTTPAIYGCDANNNNVFNEADDGEWLSCNYLSWPDLAAYLSWACLSPMTEMQYEKICRGPLQPVPGEYAWGTDQVTGNIYSLLNAGQTNETIANGAVNANEGNALYRTTNASIFGAIRNGIFATASSNRISSGGSFYGVMEMSGGSVERVITTANTQGRSFDGSNGPGSVNQNGNSAGNSSWPGVTTTNFEIDGTKSALGLMWRGGSAFFLAADMRVSDRNNIIANTDNSRDSDKGGRGVRNL